MYKTKLQEFCQKKAWQLPEYNVKKEGEDHNPHFQATVIVNGIPFHSQNPARSSKQAQNDAAQLAFLHLASPPPPPPPTTTVLASASPGSSYAIADSGSSTANRTLHPERQEANQNSHVNETAYICKDNAKSNDIRHMYKTLLQNFAQKRNLMLPSYSCEFEGPPHATRFKCKVTINGQTYETLEFFPTIKEAEHAAAKIALSALSPGSFQEEDISFYKNLLQELIQKEGCPLPVYTTTRSGEAHNPTFVSVVEVKGEVFRGQEAKTKKLAEVLAAKVAYMKLNDCKSDRGLTVMTPAYQERKVPVLSSPHSPSNVNADNQQNVSPKAGTILNPSSSSGKDQHEDIDGPFSDFPQPEMTTDWPTSSTSSNLSEPPAPEDNLSTLNLPSNHSATSNLDSDSVTKRPLPMSNLSCNRVVVRPRVENMEVPAGSTVDPRSDDTWFAVKFDSQPDR
ncbi:Double-stranded RNA-binding protein [Corchorus capsularis]|uniref:Double-stranded RNA-binding protein n=1 Tax=Corchorus capsularis TaxID=210143 RepID=A0A1R3HCB7_COCAP|nr:Double-stranded RNA-binding protein [Corchorus capsularis]